MPLKSATTNPPSPRPTLITASSFGQLGTTKRPLPAGSLPDIGSIEISQPLSTSPTANNDVLTGSNAANNLSGLAGNDYLKGLGGADTLNGNDGSDVLDGGPGNDKLNGGTGVDIVTYRRHHRGRGRPPRNPATAKRGGETDTLTSHRGGDRLGQGRQLQGRRPTTTSSRAGSARTRPPAAAGGTSTPSRASRTVRPAAVAT